MVTPTEVALVAVVARMIREVVASPSFAARVRLEAPSVGAGDEEAARVLAAWERMLSRREAGDGPLSLRG